MLYEDNGHLSGVEFIVIGSDGERIDTLQLTDQTQFNELAEKLDSLGEDYVQFKQGSPLKGETLDDLLENTDELVSINATQLNGFQSDHFSKEGHDHNDTYALENHASVNTQNGIGSETLYGHCKTINNVSKNSFVSGEALSAYQGKLLNDAITTLQSQISTWKKVTCNSYATIYVNEFLRIAYFTYGRSEYAGFSSSTSTGKQLHGANTIPAAYQPIKRTISSLYRGDVTLFIETDGSIKMSSLTKFNKINVHAGFFYKF
ncbi:MAG: hypothetical protein Q4P11_00075 [Methanobrevibacter sp.]|nr:hypothetical protein [Methanobrevibacter sp.]